MMVLPKAKPPRVLKNSSQIVVGGKLKKAVPQSARTTYERKIRQPVKPNVTKNLSERRLMPFSRN